MKLYLTSNGFEEEVVANYFKKIFLSKKVKDLSFLVVSVQDNQSDKFYLQKTLKELEEMGVSNIDVFKLGKEKFNSNKGYDMIYVCGGNTFVYLDRIRKTGLDQFIIESVRSNGSVYVGVSAGSIIAGPDISIAGWGSQADSNDIKLKNLTGLNLTNIVIYPHYKEELKLEVDSFKKEHEYIVETLEDGQALMLEYKDMDKLSNVLFQKLIN